MYNAPPVAFPVGRFVWGRALWLALSLLGAYGLIVWHSTSGVSDVGVLLAWLFWCGCVGAAAVWAPRQNLRLGRLFWSGEDWFWLPDPSVGLGEMKSVSLSVGLDLGFGLLLWVSLRDDESRKPGVLKYAWLEKQAMPSKWHGFRCAVYSRPSLTDASARAQQERF